MVNSVQLIYFTSCFLWNLILQKSTFTRNRMYYVKSIFDWVVIFVKRVLLWFMDLVFVPVMIYCESVIWNVNMSPLTLHVKDPSLGVSQGRGEGNLPLGTGTPVGPSSAANQRAQWQRILNNIIIYLL